MGRYLLLQFFTPGISKIEVFESCFYDIVTVLGRIYVFFTLFGYWVRGGGGGAPKGWVHNLLMQFFTLGSSKIEVFETYFFDTMIT